MSSQLAAALLPWVVFLVAARTGGVGFAWAAASGLVAAVAVAVTSRRRRGAVAAFEWATMAALAALGAFALGMASLWGDLDDFARPIGAGLAGLVLLGSLAWRPVSAQYLEDKVPVHEAKGTAFAALNRRITACWGVGALLAAASFAAGALVEGAAATTVLNWLVPLALLLGSAGCSSALWRTTVDDDDVGEQALLASVVGRHSPDRRRDGPSAAQRRRLRAVTGGRRD